ncbi:MAG: hypothetical protein KatS3mg035_0867 [Bacteroidia bacterium]|nr:MAG: hypothetical protein KatS3mg035_0867 [Bacteroidia bacterium]
MKLLLSIALYYFVIFSLISAQNPLYRNFSYKEMGANSLVWNIVQDQNNFLYLANNDGVLIYDGSNWKLIETPNPVRYLAMGPNKIILVGCKEDFGALIPGKNHHYYYKSYKNLLDNKLSFNEVINIHVVGNQVIYVTDKSIYHLDISNLDNKPTQLRWNFAIEGSGSNKNEVWIYSEKGGLKTIKDKNITDLQGWEAIKTSGLYKSVDCNNKQIVISLADELFKLEGSLKPFKTEIDAELAKYHIIDVACFDNGNLAIGTYSSGVYVINSQGKLVRRINKSNILPDNNIYSLFVDRGQNLWVGTAKGITQILLNLPMEVYDIDNIGGKITSLTEWKGELYLTATTGAYKKSGNNFIPLKGLENTECWRILPYNDKLFIASNQGISVVNDLSTQLIYTEKPVYYLNTQANVLWFAGQDCAGQVKADEGKYKVENLIQSVSLETNSIVQDNKGNIWIGTNYKGLVKFIPPSTAKFLGKEEGIPTAKAVVHFLNNQLIVESGKGYFVPENENQFKPYEALQMAKSNLWQANGILLTYDNSGILPFKWVNQQLVPDSISFNRFKKELPTAFYTDGNVSWIAFADQLLKLNLSKYQPKQLKTIIRFFENEKEVLYGGLGDFKNQKSQSITVPYGTVLKLIASSNDLISGEGLSYQFKIGGLIENWSEWQKSSVFSLNGIAEGQYTFHVRVQAADGTIGEPDYIHVYISPPWYRTLWAYIFYFLVIVGCVWLLIQYNLKRLEKRNEELAKKVEEATQEINEQKKELETINQELYESIIYAKRIQEAVLPSINDYLSYLNIAIVYKPRDIVSGDFYFFDKQGDNLFLVVADCTGHGVPGALMSMLGQNSLQSIITENAVNEPAEILQLLDLRVQVLLHQQGGESNDGMDMVLVKFNINSKWLEFAGANRPLFILKKDGEFIEMKPDRFPIGGDQYANKIFAPRNIQLEIGDRFFMCSDGIVDQFGGQEGRKFTPKRLRSLIKDYAHLTLEQQVKNIEKAYDEWKSNYQQTDDVLLVGFEVK